MNRPLLFLFSIIFLSFGSYFLLKQDWETYPTQRIKNGILHSTTGDVNLNFSSFTLNYSQKEAQIKIFSKHSLLYSNNPHQSLVYCGVGHASDQNNFGTWSFKDQYSQICKNQIISEITRNSSQKIRISGFFADCSENERFLMTLEEKEEKLKISIQCLNSFFNRTFFLMSSDSNENFYGFGEHSGDVNMKGKVLSNFAREPGIFRDGGFLNLFTDYFANDTGGKSFYSYYPAPLFLTSNLRGLFLLNENYNIFDLTSEDNMKLMVWSRNISLFMFNSDNFKNLISLLTVMTGRMKPLPDWIMNGGVVAITGGSDKMRIAYEQLMKSNVSIAGIWTQDWSGSRFDGSAVRLWWNWQVDRKLYPDWNEFTEELRRKNIRRMTYINPMLHNVSEYMPNSTNFFQIAADKGFLLRNLADEILYYELNSFKAGMLDFTNPKAYDFYKQIVKDSMFNDSQTSGFMADFGEDIPLDDIKYNNTFEDSDAMHNIYPYYLPKLCSEAAQEFFNTSDEIVFFTRSGNKLSPFYTRLVWAGDQLQNWGAGNGIKSAVKGMLNIGLSGAQFTHSDIGGYIAFSLHGVIEIKRTDELLKRWIELGAFSLVMRTHEGTNPDKTPQVYSTEENAAFFSRFTKIYLSWKEYRMFLMQEASETGLPVLRHMIIHYWNDPEIVNMDEQYMLGEDLIVAPVLEEGVNKKWVYFPREEGVKWVNLWSGEPKEACGRWEEVEAPMGKPPVFFREGSKWGEKMVNYLKENLVI